MPVPTPGREGAAPSLVLQELSVEVPPHTGRTISIEHSARSATACIFRMKQHVFQEVR
jgi:hypothetical protein